MITRVDDLVNLTQQGCPFSLTWCRRLKFLSVKNHTASSFVEVDYSTGKKLIQNESPVAVNHNTRGRSLQSTGEVRDFLDVTPKYTGGNH